VSTNKEFLHGKELLERLMTGVNKLADNVSATLGPKGRNVIIQQAGKTPFITKDGVTVALHVDLKDPFENAAAQLVKQAAVQTNTEAGDGTTTSTVLTRELLRNAFMHISQGVTPIELKRGMDKALEDVLDLLSDAAIPVRKKRDVKNIATISANNDQVIGELIAQAVDKAGKDGAISIQDSKSTKTSLELAEGFRFPGGFHAAAFITDKTKGAAVYNDCLFFVTDIKIDRVHNILPMLTHAAQMRKPLVIVAPEIYDQALAALIANQVKGSMKIVAIKPSYYGEERRGLLQDLATSVGAKFCQGNNVKFGANGEIDFQPKDFGTAHKIEVTKSRTTILGGSGNQEDIDLRIAEIKAEIEATEDLHECERLQQRITRLASGVALIKVGGFSDGEVTETRHRVVDALEAVRAAQEAGMVPGGGSALWRVSRALEEKGIPMELNKEQRLGYRIVIDSITAPMRQIASNSFKSYELVEERLLSAERDFEKDPQRLGYNFRTDVVEDLVTQGVVDPVKVTKTALRSSVSVAGTLLLSSNAIIETD
jgi:chaperonin GroEL